MTDLPPQERMLADVTTKWQAAEAKVAQLESAVREDAAIKQELADYVAKGNGERKALEAKVAELERERNHHHEQERILNERCEANCDAFDRQNERLEHVVESLELIRDTEKVNDVDVPEFIRSLARSALASLAGEDGDA